MHLKGEERAPIHEQMGQGHVIINTFEVYPLAVQAFVLADEPHRSHTKRVRSAYSCQIRERGLIISSISQYLDGRSRNVVFWLEKGSRHGERL